MIWTIRTISNKLQHLHQMFTHVHNHVHVMCIPCDSNANYPSHILWNKNISQLCEEQLNMTDFYKCVWWLLIHLIYPYQMPVRLDRINNREQTENGQWLMSSDLIQPCALEKPWQDDPTLVLEVNERVPTSWMTVIYVTGLSPALASSVTVHLR